MKQTAKTIVSSAMLALLLVAIPACNTVKGAGEDLKSASEKTERAIDKATD